MMRRLLAGTLADPDGAGCLSVATRTVEIAPTLAGDERALVAGLHLGPRLAVVSDPVTHGILGARVASALAGAFDVIDVVLGERPEADSAAVAEVRAKTQPADALVAVGSGTINDLCKYASFLERKPYAVFGTAPSMNGYTSVSAAITESGHKKTLAAHAPRGVFLDVEILAHAPLRMIRAGLGDSIARSTAQADWLLAHLLFGETYRRAPFELLAADEDALLGRAAALVTGDLAAMELLARTLVLSGFGMALCGGSYPASQGEHLISHYIDMLGDPRWPSSFHGEHIAVTTLTMARLQHALLGGPAPALEATAIDEGAVKRHYGDELGASCWQGFSKKVLDAEQARALGARLAREWPGMKEQLLAVMRPADELEAVLSAAGAPTRPEQLHVPPDFYREAVLHAREIRDRYTFLDLAGDSGALEEFVA